MFAVGLHMPRELNFETCLFSRLQMFPDIKQCASSSNVRLDDFPHVLS